MTALQLDPEPAGVRGVAPVRVVIAEDSLLVRAAVVRLLDEAGVEVVGEAGDGDDLVRKVRAHRPDVAIIDIRMPPDHGRPHQQRVLGDHDAHGHPRPPPRGSP